MHVLENRHHGLVFQLAANCVYHLRGLRQLLLAVFNRVVLLELREKLLPHARAAVRNHNQLAVLLGDPGDLFQETEFAAAAAQQRVQRALVHDEVELLIGKTHLRGVHLQVMDWFVLLQRDLLHFLDDHTGEVDADCVLEPRVVHLLAQLRVAHADEQHTRALGHGDHFLEVDAQLLEVEVPVELALRLAELLVPELRLRELAILKQRLHFIIKYELELY